MDWSLCIVCQQDTSESLRCPKNRVNCDPVAVYKTFLQNVEAFRSLDALPIKILFDAEATPELLSNQRASWHHSCHQKFVQSRLDRARDKKRKLDEGAASIRRSKRQSLESKPESCIICASVTSEKMHEYSTKKTELNLRTMAIELDDTDLLGRISGGDCVAIEARYHFSCLTDYRNRYRSSVREKTREIDTDYERAKARAFVELVSYIEGALEDGTYLFKVKDLWYLLQNRLKELGHEFTINKTRLKDFLMSHFEELGIQEQFLDGKSKILVFPEGMQKLIKNAFDEHNYQEEALLLQKWLKFAGGKYLD